MAQSQELACSGANDNRFVSSIDTLASIVKHRDSGGNECVYDLECEGPEEAYPEDGEDS